ncbi:hypothetical protein COV13_01035 [Candidatus Woesearchaeota archaeon CG10_big_fil_rev_8_21_14_0_10_32_9]|nr:MAG: hypothetical protein COV13_01035 [Candidatus Woesearchaeota archaeon CG10_big_fil_rev_8_21_14_0_10_32_9]
MRHSDNLSNKYGITTIFDDVFRGLKEGDKKLSASENSESGIILETSSKRYGARGVGITWTLVPKTSKVHLNNNYITDELSLELATRVLSTLNSCKYNETIREHLITNTSAFLFGLNYGLNPDKNLGLTYNLPFAGSPFFTLNLPEQLSAIDLKKTLGEQGIGLTTGYDWMLPSDLRLDQDIKNKVENSTNNNFFRICPTKETPDRCTLAGRIVASQIYASNEALKNLQKTSNI